MEELFELQTLLNSLHITEIRELKAFKAPPALVKLVAEAVMTLLGIKSKEPWRDFQKLAANPADFIKKIAYYDKDEVPALTLK